MQLKKKQFIILFFILKISKSFSYMMRVTFYIFFQATVFLSPQQTNRLYIYRREGNARWSMPPSIFQLSTVNICQTSQTMCVLFHVFTREKRDKKKTGTKAITCWKIHDKHKEKKKNETSLLPRQKRVFLIFPE